MAHPRFALAAALTAAIVAAPAASFAAALPTTINLLDDAHQVTIQQVRQQLRTLGFTDLGTIARDGRIFELPALWEGKPINLKVNAGTRTIRQIIDPAPIDANALPTRLSLVGEPHEVTIPQVVAGLRGLGFADVSNVQQDGRFFAATAVWRGESVDLRYDASGGMITDEAVATTRLAEEFPSRMVLAGAAHEASIQDIRRGLATLGFAQIRDVEQDGRIFTASANWQGQALDLRVDAASRRITRQ